jgi:deoxyadenosine/deoxycytidine kinase
MVEVRRMPSIIAVEGNIGAGKSTVLTLLQFKIDSGEYPFFGTYPPQIIQEPLARWLTEIVEDGKPILSLFYENPKKYAAVFQGTVMKDIVETILASCNIDNHPVMIVERSLCSSFHVFAKTLFNKGDISAVEYNELQKTFDEIDISFKPVAIVYLKTTPELCMSRVISRRRDGEQHIDQDYLTTIHMSHEDWIRNTSEKCDTFGRCTSNPLILDTSTASTSDVCDRIMNFVSGVVHSIHAENMSSISISNTKR